MPTAAVSSGTSPTSKISCSLGNFFFCPVRFDRGFDGGERKTIDRTAGLIVSRIARRGGLAVRLASGGKIFVAPPAIRIDDIAQRLELREFGEPLFFVLISAAKYGW